MILLERSSDDLKTLQIASETFKSLWEWMKEHGLKAFYSASEPVEKDGTQPMRKILEFRRVAGIPEAYHDCLLVLSMKTSKWGGRYYSEYRNPQTGEIMRAIVLYIKRYVGTPVFLGSSKNVETVPYVSIFRYRLYGIFNHEFIHYLDDKRFGMEKAVKKNPHPENSFEHHTFYINSPVEFNAYYMQGIQAIMSDLDHHLRKRMQLPKDFKTFFHTFITENQYFDGDFRTLMNDRWRRKFIVRLLAFFHTLQDRYKGPVTAKKMFNPL